MPSATHAQRGQVKEELLRTWHGPLRKILIAWRSGEWGRKQIIAGQLESNSVRILLLLFILPGKWCGSVPWSQLAQRLLDSAATDTAQEAGRHLKYHSSIGCCRTEHRGQAVTSVFIAFTARIAFPRASSQMPFLLNTLLLLSKSFSWYQVLGPIFHLTAPEICLSLSNHQGQRGDLPPAFPFSLLSLSPHFSDPLQPAGERTGPGSLLERCCPALTKPKFNCFLVSRMSSL